MDSHAISVLLVEDNPADARLVRELLNEVGGGEIVLRHVDCLAAAIAHVRQESVDLLLLDLTLPDSFGLDSVSRMLECAPGLPVIVLTGMVDEEMANQAIHLGAQDYLVKGGVEGHRLARVIRYALERKKNEQQIQQIKQQYESILVSLSEGVCVFDREGKVRYANPSACQMLGWPLAELLGQQLHPLIHGEKQDGISYPEHDCPYHQALRDGETYHLAEDVFWRRDRSPLPVEVNAAPIREMAGVTGVVLTFRDITSRKKNEEVLMRTQQELMEREYFTQRVLDNIPQHIFWKDRNSVFRGCNRAAAQAVGLGDPAEIVGKTDFDLHSDRDVAQYLFNSDIGVMESAQPEYHRLTRLGQNDSTAWLDVSKIPLQAFKGGVSGLLITYEDVSERQRAENALQQLNETLEQRVADAVARERETQHLMIQQSRHAAMGEMIGNIAHQWRQPLNALSIVLQNIRLDYEEGLLNLDSVTDYSKTGTHLIQKMSSTIDDFRNFFRPHKQPEKFSLQEAVRETLSLLDASFMKDDIQVQCEAGDDLMLWGYPNEFGQVLLNILANAKEASIERGVVAPCIHISFGSENGQGKVSIRDNAGGVPDEVAAKIFDPYYTTKERGTGIGLYMSKTIIENNMKGQILFRNVDGGAEFSLLVPLAE